MTPEEIKAWNVQVADLLVEHSICQCAAEDIPCLKHNRLAFEVYWFAKYERGYITQSVGGGWGDEAVARYPNWFPLARRGVRCDPAQDHKLLARLGLPKELLRYARSTPTWPSWRAWAPGSDPWYNNLARPELVQLVRDYAEMVRDNDP